MKLEEFIEKNKEKTFRYWIRKRMWTPYEMDKKDPYQTDLENDECEFCRIVECVDLGYDHLIGIVECDATEPYQGITYYRLSEFDFRWLKDDEN